MFWLPKGKRNITNRVGIFYIATGNQWSLLTNGCLIAGAVSCLLHTMSVWKFPVTRGDIDLLIHLFCKNQRTFVSDGLYPQRRNCTHVPFLYPESSWILHVMENSSHSNNCYNSVHYKFLFVNNYLLINYY